MITIDIGRAALVLAALGAVLSCGGILTDEEGPFGCGVWMLLVAMLVAVARWVLV